MSYIEYEYMSDIRYTTFEIRRLTFAELWSSACALETRLLALFDATVATEEAFLLESSTICRVNQDECTADTEAHRITLAWLATTRECDVEVDLLLEVEQCERSNGVLDECRVEVLLDVRTVHGDFPLTLLEDTHFRNGVLALTEAVEEWSRCRHGLERKRNWLLRIVLVRRTCVDVELLQDVLTGSVLRDHTLDGMDEDFCRILTHLLFHCRGAKVTEPTRVAEVLLLFELGSRNLHFLRIDDDHVVARHHVRDE